MAVLKRYICSKHGEFDAWADGSVRCPAAKCRCKPREMVSAPAIHTSGRTARADNALKNLASDYKMTDIASVKEGDSQAKPFLESRLKADPRPGDSVIWGNAGRFQMDSILKGGQFRSVNGEQVGINHSELPKNKPKTASYIADHENLKIDR